MVSEGAEEPQFRLAEGETVVKDYNALVMTLPRKMEGHIVVTNKRVILHGSNKSLLGSYRTRWVHDIAIEDVISTDVFYQNEKNIWSIVFGAFLILLGLGGFAAGLIVAILGLVTIVGFIVGGFMCILSVAVIITGISKILKSIKRGFWVKIKGAHVSGIELGGEKKGFIQIFGIRPGPDAEALTREIGALIQEIRSKNRKEARAKGEEEPRTSATA